MSNIKQKESTRRRRKSRFSIGTMLCSLLVLAAFLLLYAANWFLSVYGQIGFDAVLFTLDRKSVV